MNEAIFAAGCFWGVEVAFKKLKGVSHVEVGYTGGVTDHPTYREVCTGQTGHAEAVKITYDPAKLSYEALLDHFFQIHNPTSINRQGPDVGSEYRSAIFYQTEGEKELAEKAKKDWEKRLHASIATEITKASSFYRAEEVHQCYLAKHGRA